MISDFVKGKSKYEYAVMIQKGIQLHRDIDHFTDTHPVNHLAKLVFKPDYRLYAGAFVDIVYDHFLANDQAQFSNDAALNLFCHQTYSSLRSNINLFPDKFKRIFPYMETQNWLYHYRTNEGIEKSFGGLVRRAAYLNESEKAFHQFELQYELLKQCYQSFFGELKEFSKKRLNQLLENNE